MKKDWTCDIHRSLSFFAKNAPPFMEEKTHI